MPEMQCRGRYLIGEVWCLVAAMKSRRVLRSGDSGEPSRLGGPDSRTRVAELMPSPMALPEVVWKLMVGEWKKRS
jgi:hypothetical protein